MYRVTRISTPVFSSINQESSGRLVGVRKILTWTNKRREKLLWIFSYEKRNSNRSFNCGVTDTAELSSLSNLNIYAELKSYIKYVQVHSAWKSGAEIWLNDKNELLDNLVIHAQQITILQICKQYCDNSIVTKVNIILLLQHWL